MRVGFVGTGAISAAVIEGLCRNSEGRTVPQIIVSPRSESIAKDLASRHPNVRRAESNQEVVDASDLVCVGVLPPQLGEALLPLTFRDGQICVSFVAGLPVAAIAAGIAAEVRICRVVPLPAIARRQGPILLHPSIPEVKGLFAPLGLLIEPADEDEMAAIAHGAALMSSFFKMATSGIDGLAAHGVRRREARDYLMSMYGAMATTGLETPMAELGLLPERHETRGGVNKAARLHLENLGWFYGYRGSIDAAAHRTEALSNG